MRRFVEGADRGQTTLLPECLGDWVEESNPVRAVDVFVEALDLADLGFDGVQPLATGRPAYHPSTLLKLYIYGYLNRVQSSRRLEREAGRNLEVMWLTGRLAPDCGMPRRLSHASVVRVFLPRSSVSSTGHSSHILIRCSTRRSTIRRATDFISSVCGMLPK